MIIDFWLTRCVLCSHVGNGEAGSGLSTSISCESLAPTVSDRPVIVRSRSRMQHANSRSLSSARSATSGTGTKWFRRNLPTSPSTPPFSWAPSMPHQREPRFVEVVRAQRDEPLVLDPVAALQRLLRRARQVVVADRREYAGEPVQRVHVPLEERLLALRLERHHETRPREARAHQKQAEHRQHARRG